jgi:serine/threonine-protein kinase
MIIMEYVEGQPLHRLMEGGALSGERTALLGRQIADGMAVAHAHGVIHGDLKPANIIVTAEQRVKITDFGMARRAQPDGHRPNGSNGDAISGTPRYLAPERLRGDPVTQSADVFALGLMLYEMLTGREALTGQTLNEILVQLQRLDAARYAEALPEPFACIVRRALAPDAGKRDLRMAEIAVLLS